MAVGAAGGVIDRGAGAEELATTLEHLVETVADHLSLEDSMIYALAEQALPGADAGSAERMRDAFEQLKADWGGYLTCWTPEAIAADRDGFIAASRAMLPRLRDRVKLENDLLGAIAVRAATQPRGR
ncbi:hemerythrin domain-containing protein [Sphingomonas psychrotolerans]|uniref:Hemerythrin domain-containing protein n=1 Tax=Sphingomonas psychrotolerans TaxID=1327635 RepID=A0ABU3N8M2_9SPHN|nr:hemerythrin domain-containing protein [Sphingomonas psychrotolerans]MDT8760818.1 hemerythrin domain-containing protein [Sphingomonas psychrotolerans]